jgi:hypothetical protein
MLVGYGALVVALVFGLTVGYLASTATRWDEGVAQVVPTPGTGDPPRFVTFADPDTGHSVAGFSPEWITWIDRNEVWHESGLPECVREGATVRYAWEKVSAADGSWRETVLVDCRA